MVCPGSKWVDEFLEGRLEAALLGQMEAHVEGCEECFLRVAAGAADLPAADRASLNGRSSQGSRVHRSLSALGTTVEGAVDPGGAEWSRQTIGPYVITGLMGIGGMSVVYRARHRATGREVAVKTVKMPFVASSLAMLRQEIEFLREAQHPAIVRVLDSDLIAADPWYAMELFEEPTLHELNRRLWRTELPSSGRSDRDRPGVRAAGGRLPEVLRLFARLCDPIAFLHGAGMVHGDIKPSNVFLRENEQPVLMDFGLAARTKGTVGRETLDVTGRIRGTLPYIAPEIIRGKLPDARADLYAVGCMLYESIVGTPPFASRNGTKIIDMHLSVAPTPASARVTEVPDKLDSLLLRLLAKDPAERFGHASALAASLWSIAEALASSPDQTSIVVSSQQSTPLFRPPLVGRDSEVETILHDVHAARASSSGTTILLAGESGIGKTFLTAELAQKALLAGVDVITSECPPSIPTSLSAETGAAPLQGFRRFFETLRDRCRERGLSEVERLFGPHLVLLAEYLPALRHLDRKAAESAPAPALPASAARERIVEAVLDTLSAYASERPVLLALDDLQWADDLTMAVLDRLDEEFLAKVPLVVLGTYRSEEATAAIQQLAVKPSTRLLHLGRLAKAQVGAIVSGMLSMASAPAPLTEYINVHAEGVPFFAAEYLRELVAAGALLYRGGAWSLREDWATRPPEHSPGALPHRLRELIRGRLNRLPPEVVEMLEAGAILGRRFSLSRVGRMVGRPVSELVPHLSSSIAADITRTDGLDEMTFVHDKIRETLYAGLAPDRREALHLLAATAMDDGDSTPPEHDGLIGHHLKNSGRIADAIRYLERAGAHALRMAANGDAERFYREVIELDATLPDRQPALRRARWHRERADAFQGLGMMAECAASLKQSAALLGRPFPTRASTLALRLAREVVRQVWHRTVPAAIRPPAADAIEATEEVVRVFDRMHQASFYLGNDADLILSTTVSLNASEQAGSSPYLTVAYTNAAMMAGVLPLPKLAEHYFKLATEVSRSAPDDAATAWLLLMEGAYRTWQGQRERSISCLDRAIEMYEARGFFRRLDEAASARVGIDVFAGFHQPALARLDALEARARRRRDLQILCWTALQRVEAHVIRGEHARALVAIERAAPLLPSLSRPERIWATGFEAYLRHHAGDIESASRLVRESTDLISKGPPVHSYCVSTYDRLAEVAVALVQNEPPGPRRREYLHTARRACSILRRSSRTFPIARPAAALHGELLNLATRRASPGAVLRRWNSAIVQAAALSLPLHELRLHRAILARLPASDDRRQAHEARARELLRVMELEPDFATSAAIAPPSRGARVEVEREVELSRP